MNARFRTAAVILAGISLALAGCTEQSTTTGVSTPTSTLLNNTIDPAQVNQIAEAVRSQKLTLTGQHDATKQLCPDAGCSSAVAFDQLTILKFPTTGRAQIYNGSVDDGYQVLDLVVTFPPNTASDVRDRYFEAVRIAVR